MKIKLVKVPRRPPWPWWAAALILGWMAGVAATVWLARVRHLKVELCLFKRLTGYPCLTCGATRGALRILHGDVLGGWAKNPLLFSIFAIFAAAVLLRVVLKRAVRIEWTPTSRRIAWALAIAAVILNWAYVIVYVG